MELQTPVSPGLYEAFHNLGQLEKVRGCEFHAASSWLASDRLREIDWTRDRMKSQYFLYDFATGNVLDHDGANQPIGGHVTLWEVMSVQWRVEESQFLMVPAEDELATANFAGDPAAMTACNPPHH